MYRITLCSTIVKLIIIDERHNHQQRHFTIHDLNKEYINKLSEKRRVVAQTQRPYTTPFTYQTDILLMFWI